MADKVTVRWVNKERFFRKLVGVVPKVEANLDQANNQTATEFVDMALRLVPVDTGTLRNSIRIIPGERGSYIVQAGGSPTTKDGYDYSLGVEYGTVDTPAQPFFWPSYRVQKKKKRARNTRALNKAIKDAGF